MRAAVLLAAAAALLAGCAEPSIADCGLLIHAPARPIDEGVRFDVKEVAGDPPGVDNVDYRITNHSLPDRPVAFEGNVGDLLVSGGSRALRFLDAKNDSLLGVGDAFVVREQGGFVLQLSRGPTLVGSSVMCER